MPTITTQRYFFSREVLFFNLLTRDNKILPVRQKINSSFESGTILKLLIIFRTSGVATMGQFLRQQ